MKARASDSARTSALPSPPAHDSPAHPAAARGYAPTRFARVVLGALLLVLGLLVGYAFAPMPSADAPCSREALTLKHAASELAARLLVATESIPQAEEAVVLSGPPMHAAMKVDERLAFQKYVSRSRNYFEFGCGGSTFVAAASGVACITSVDTSAEWIQKVEGRLANHTCLSMHYVDVGALRAFGFPTSSSHRHLWPLYSGFIGLQTTPPDTVLVDGRFRVACALQTWLTQPAETIVMIHDYFNRPSYHVVEEWFDVIERVGTLIVMQPNAEKQQDEAWREQAQQLVITNQYVVS